MIAVIAEGRKNNGGVAAVADVSFTVAAGEIFVLRGQNGAGKTPSWRSSRASRP